MVIVVNNICMGSRILIDKLINGAFKCVKLAFIYGEYAWYYTEISTLLFLPGMNEVLSETALNPCHQNHPCYSYGLYHRKRKHILRY
jgi:hypothetical protein